MTDVIGDIIEAIIAVFIIAVFLGAVIPLLQQISPISATIGGIALVILLIGVIFSIIKTVSK